MNNWQPFEFDPEPQNERRIERVVKDGVEITVGHRVRLRPLGRADVFDIALDGKIATIVGIEQDYEDRIQQAVVLEDDPGQEFGFAGQPGHRFFFGVEEVEPQSMMQQ
jgi:hypothetical protein